MDESTILRIIGGFATAALMIASGAFAWILKVERSMLTRDEHREICDSNQTTIMRKIDKLTELVEERDHQASMQRDKVAGELEELNKTVSVLKDRSDTEQKRRRR